MKNTSVKIPQNTAITSMPGFNHLNSGPAPSATSCPDQNIPHNDAWLSATGPVPIRLSNDYLFRALLQRSNSTLKGLICSRNVRNFMQLMNSEMQKIIIYIVTSSASVC